MKNTPKEIDDKIARGIASLKRGEGVDGEKFLDSLEAELNAEEEFRATKAAIDEALEQAHRGEGLFLEDFEKNMRAKYRIQR